jgi:vacuolar-type H+-ATPase subunit I/STV1
MPRGIITRGFLHLRRFNNFMDGTETEQGEQQTSISEAPSAAQQGTPDSPRTFTREQVTKQISDALARAGREAKALEAAKADITAREARLKAWEQEREDAELGDLTSDPAEKLTLKAYREKLRADRQALNEQLSALDKEKAEWEAVIAETRAAIFGNTASTIAEKHGVSAEVLKDKAARLGISSLEALEELASVMPKKAAVTAPDSGRTTGGSADLSKMSAGDLIKRGLEKRNK